MMATLLLSQGTPMILAGDEFGRTQGGNNNAYCQDSEISWLHWDLQDKGEALLRFTQKLIGLRHKHPVLRHSRFLTAEYNDDLGCKELTWINANGHEMSSEEWGDGNTKCFGMLIDGRAQLSGVRKRGDDATMLLVLNSWQDGVNFTLPEAPEGNGWSLLVDTNIPDEGVARTFKFEEVYQVTGRSVLLFAMQKA